MLLNIALLSAPWTTLSWLPCPDFPTEFWQPGLRVLVPLGRGSIRAGVITDLDDKDQEQGIRYKEVLWPLEKSPLLDTATLALLLEQAKRQALSPGFIMGHVLPAGLRNAAVKFRYQKKLLGGRQLAYLQGEERKKAVADFLGGSLAIASGREKNEGLISLCCEPPWNIRPAAQRQKQVLDELWQNGPLAEAELSRRLGQNATPFIKKLLEAGLVEAKSLDEEEEFIEPPASVIELNDSQKKVLSALDEAFASGKGEIRLLFGVTGSGKTAVYLEFARHCLACGKSVLALAPEVALALKLHKDFLAAMPDQEIFFYHGYQAPGMREKIWLAIANSAKPCVVLGTRSAIFLPIRNLGSIILDEEHDASFKQDEVFAYHARDLAWYRIAASGGILLLGSATPDVRIFCASESSAIARLEMPARISGKALPPVEIVDIGKGALMGPDGTLLGQQSLEALRQCAASGEQAVILLNRRGYAPMIFCRECGKTMRCPHCSIGLAYHKDLGKLVCHYCGYSLDYPSPCPDCGQMKYLSVGEGTERLAERLESLTGTRILRLDRDNTRTPGKIESILSAFATGQSPFLAGTQMLSKGHHFPNVTLAVVADGDIGLNMPDYRAAEKTFQLLVQAAGRAGRGERPGRVIIQTRTPEHYCWQYIGKYDYRGFYEEEMKRRKKFNYPPFVKLGLIRFTCAMEDDQAGSQILAAGKILAEKAASLKVRLFGPALAPIPCLRGKKRYHCMLKSDNWPNIREIYFEALKLLENNSDIRIFLDLDPVNML